MPTNFKIKIGEIGPLTYVTLTFRNGVDNRKSDLKRFVGGDIV